MDTRAAKSFASADYRRMGLSLPTLLRGRTISAARPGALGKAKNCIVLFLMGGPPQHSTWDPKPDAPAEVRGEFGPTDTNVPGIRVCSLLPRLARQADKLCLLRAVSTGDNAAFFERILHAHGRAARADERGKRQSGRRTTGPVLERWSVIFAATGAVYRARFACRCTFLTPMVRSGRARTLGFSVAPTILGYSAAILADRTCAFPSLLSRPMFPPIDWGNDATCSRASTGRSPRPQEERRMSTAA